MVHYLAHCKDMRKELGVPEKIDVSLVHAVRAPGASVLHCAVCLWRCGFGGHVFLVKAEELMNRAFDVSALCGTSTKATQRCCWARTQCLTRGAMGCVLMLIDAQYLLAGCPG